MRKFHSAKVLYRVSPDPIFLGAGGTRLSKNQATQQFMLGGLRQGACP